MRKTQKHPQGERSTRRRSNGGRGAVLGPSKQPRREEPTDASIGKGEDVIRPREEARDEARDQPHAAPDQSAIDDAAGRGPGEEQAQVERDPMEPARDDMFPPR